MRTRGRISHHSDRDGSSVPVRVTLASVIIALAFPALILSLTCHSQCDSDSRFVLRYPSVIVVLYACMACQCFPTCFTTCQGAAVHYAHSVACQQSQRGIATVVLPSRTADIDTGGSWAAGVWAGPPKHARGAWRVLARAMQVPGHISYVIY